MTVLIKQVKIVDTASEHHGVQTDVLIREGRIERIGADMKADGAQVVLHPGLHLSPGWMDLGAVVGDPGFEHREDIASLCRAAQAGGFTGVAVFPNTDPVMQTKAGIEYLLRGALDAPVELFPIGALTTDCKGREITEMIDMHRHGAAAFSDGLHPVQDGGTMLRALQYVKAFGGRVINAPLDKSVAADGQLHEGVVSTALGMKGIPALAEELMVRRDLSLTAYTGSRLHISGISTAASVELVRRAKAEGVDVTCSTPVLNLAFDEEVMRTFDTNFKVLPPLRKVEDMEALRQGLTDGTIDVIFSNHVPWEEEAKELEFPYAAFGAEGLETAFALANTTLGRHLSLGTLIEKLTLAPRKVLDLAPVHIREGAVANCTLFLPEEEWTVTESDLRSHARNNPLVGKKLKGRVWGTILDRRYKLSNNL